MVRPVVITDVEGFEGDVEPGDISIFLGADFFADRENKE
jgi:hypothetical protein